MTTKAQKIAELKTQYPTLTKGVNDEVVELDAKEYNATISQWADTALEQQAQIAKSEADVIAKSALLNRLGISEDEAKLLLS